MINFNKINQSINIINPNVSVNANVNANAVEIRRKLNRNKEGKLHNIQNKQEEIKLNDHLIIALKIIITNMLILKINIY